MPPDRVTVALPSGFDPRRHQRALERLIADRYGDGFDLDSIDLGEGTATASRQGLVTEVAAKATDTFAVRLARGTLPAHGDKVAAKLDDQYPGFRMTQFEPFLGRATMTRMSEDEARCRGALAVALGVKPWDVQVRKLPDDGFEIGLPRGYVPSRHDDRLAEVTQLVVGRPGWRIRCDPAALTARMVPGEPPLFPEAVPFEMATLGGNDPDRSVLGVTLPEQGVGAGPVKHVDWAASAFLLVAGLPGSGKSMTLSSLLAQQLAAGASVAIVDDRAKAIDFVWAKEFLRDGGWGCDSEAHAVATLAMIYEEGRRRSSVLAERGYVNWLDMPPGERFQPIFVIVDELSALTVQDPVPKGVPKDHPMVVEVNDLNYKRALVSRYVNKIIAELRFVGVRMVVSTQVTNATTGLPPSLRNKIGHRVLQGTNPSKPARTQAFNDEQAVPHVPEHVKASGRAARGVGVADLEGQAPVVFKSLFATTDAYAARLRALGLPATTRPSPTAAEVATYSPDLSDGDDQDNSRARPRSPVRPGLRARQGAGAEPVTGKDGTVLHGAAAASRALSLGTGGPSPGSRAQQREEAGWASRSGQVTVTRLPSCPDCATPIKPDGTCGCR